MIRVCMFLSLRPYMVNNVEEKPASNWIIVSTDDLPLEHINFAFDAEDIFVTIEKNHSSYLNMLSFKFQNACDTFYIYILFVALLYIAILY